LGDGFGDGLGDGFGEGDGDGGGDVMVYVAFALVGPVT
jgi:hypothetical protein